MFDSQSPLIRSLFGAHDSLTEAESRQASLLALISVTLFILNIAGVVYGLSVAGSVVPVIYTNLVVTVVVYIMSRTRQVVPGAWLLVMSLLAQVFVWLLMAQLPQFSATIIVLLVLPSLLATLLLGAGATIAVVAITVLGSLLLSAAAPWMVFSEVGLALVLLTVILLLAITAAVVRERDMEAVEQRARELEEYRQSLEAEVDTRTRDVMSAADIGRVIASIREKDELLRRVVGLISERFEFYLTQVFLLDDEQENAVLVQTSGPEGEKLRAEGYQVALKAQSPIAEAIRTGSVTVINDIAFEDQYHLVDILPKTRSELIVPLRAGDVVIGLLDIHSTKPGAFGQADIPTFQSIGDQLSVALENVNLFARAQRDLQEIELLNKQLTGEAWSRFMAGRARPVGFRSVTEEVIEPITIESGTGPLSPPKDNQVTLPLTVRGETIGQLEITPKNGKVADEDTQVLLEAVAERVALALDSTRLSEQSRRQAEHEQILSQLSADLQATTDLENILRISVERASQSMGASRGFIQLRIEVDTETGLSET